MYCNIFSQAVAFFFSPFLHLKFFNTFFKGYINLQLLQNINYIPRIVQCILVAYLTPSSLYLPLPQPYIASPPRHW